MTKLSECRYYPEAALVNRDLVPLTRERRAIDCGDAPTIEAFAGALVSMRQGDGVLKCARVSAYAIKAYELVRAGRWDELLRLCRFLRDPVLWTLLAALAIKSAQLDKAEAAFAAIEQVRDDCISMHGYALISALGLGISINDTIIRTSIPQRWQ